MIRRRRKRKGEEEEEQITVVKDIKELEEKLEQERELLKNRIKTYLEKLIEGLYTPSLLWWQFLGVLLIGLLFGIGIGILIAPSLFKLTGWWKP